MIKSLYCIIGVVYFIIADHYLTGAYISENSTHYFLPDWAYLGQESCQNTVKEYSEHKIKAIFELSTLENPYIDSLFGLIYEFLIYSFFIFLSYLPNWGDNSRFVVSRGW